MQPSLSKRKCLFLLIIVAVVCFAESIDSDIPFVDIEDMFLSAGHFHTCALENRPGVAIGGGIKCWGDNRKGQTSSPPGIYKQISSGKFFSCAVSLEERVSCWGDLEDITPPEGRFTQVSVGHNHACGIRKDGRVHCWGRNDFGESNPGPHYYAQVNNDNLKIFQTIKYFNKNST